ncbi:MAG: hypothetical protein ACPF8V_11065 [Luteibaculum sp.]
MKTTHIHGEFLADGGPIYTETNLNHLIVEPFNTVSAFLFLILAGYWYLRLRGQFGKYKFLTAATALLTIGAVGGTVYHAFRVDAFFMYMDWVPIILLCWGAAVFFVFRLSKSYWSAGGIMLLSVLAQFLVFRIAPPSVSTNWSYAILGFMVVVPTVYNMVKTKFHQWWWVVYAFSAFVLALGFRILDPWEIIPIGTHFLWHTFGVLAGHFMFKYVFEVQKRDLAQLREEKIRA